MCGLVGIISSKNNEFIGQQLKKMLYAIRYRGPDSQGIWQDDRISLGHVRLSIHDLSSDGYQPVLSGCGRYIIAFNGEIYNYQELKKQLLKKYDWQAKTQCDTEVLANLFSFYSVDDVLKQLHGMFAFALWDRKEKMCYLVRDRFGEKPLYYAKAGKDIVFASELKAMRQYQNWHPNISQQAVAEFLRYSYIPEPLSIYENCYKVNAGHYLQIDYEGNIQNKQYWSLYEVAEKAQDNLLDISLVEAEKYLKKELEVVISRQMVSDVPLGAFLSGGVDSSLICAIMQSLAKHPIHTFSIGFAENDFNEAPYAKAVAQHLGCEHTELYVPPKVAMEVIPKLPEIYDEPFADSSQIPTYLVSQLAKKDVTVILTGDAGDELFGGYSRYFYTHNFIAQNRLFSHLLQFVPLNISGNFYNSISGFIPQKYRFLHFKSKLEKLKFITKNCKNYQEYYEYLISTIKSPGDYLLKQSSNRGVRTRHVTGYSPIEEMMLVDTERYLTSNNLTKVDRAAMWHSLETRIPFLDQDIFEFAWRLPASYKIHNKNGKRILKNLLYEYVPKTLIERPKMGFGVPIDHWLRNDLKGWATDVLSKDNIVKQGILNPEVIVQAMEDFQKTGYEPNKIWNLIVLQAWLEEWHH